MITKSKNVTRVDWIITIMPLALIVALCVIFFIAPDASNNVLSQIRFFFGIKIFTYRF